MSKLKIFNFVTWVTVIHIVFVYLISTNVLSIDVYLFFVALLVGCFLYLSTYDSLLLFISQLPFYLVIPKISTTFASWRLFIVIIFLKWVALSWQTYSRNNSESKSIIGFLLSLRGGTPTRQSSIFLLRSSFKIPLFWFICLLVWASVSLLWSRFPIIGGKQILFVVNALLLFFVTRHQVNTVEKIKQFIKYIALSSTLIIATGFFQFFLTLVFDQYYFWKYWAYLVSRSFYGGPISDVLLYSNSWFTVTPEGRNLRMFGILPDSHSFGIIATFAMYLWLPFIYSESRRVKWLARISISMSALALLLSGTRGVWAGILAPVLLLIVVPIIWKQSRGLAKKLAIPLIVIVITFLVSPLINMTLGAIKAGFAGGSLFDRAASIYDLDESSNVGRIAIWKSSLGYIAKHPFGTGQGNFIISLFDHVPENATYTDLGEVKNKKYNLPQKYITAHSLYLQILVELGIVGFIIFGLFCLSGVYRLWQKLKLTIQENDIFMMRFIGGTSLLVFWMLAYSVFDVTLLNDRVLLYIFSLVALL